MDACCGGLVPGFCGLEELSVESPNSLERVAGNRGCGRNGE